MESIFKLRKYKSDNQKKALNVMKTISRKRKKLPYITIIKNGEYRKNFFADFVEGFVCDEFKLKREKDINNKGYDATKKINGRVYKIEIKDVTQSAPYISDSKYFFYLILVELERDCFSVKNIYIYNKKIVDKYLHKNKQFRPPEEIKSKYKIL